MNDGAENRTVDECLGRFRAQYDRIDPSFRDDGLDAAIRPQKLEYLHKLPYSAAITSRTDQIAAAVFLTQIGSELDPRESSRSVRNQARIVLAQKILEADRVVWPRDAQDTEATAALQALILFYALDPEHNRNASPRNKKAVWRFLEKCWIIYRENTEYAPLIIRALIVSCGFEVLRRQRITEATGVLYDTIREWIQGLDFCGRGHVSFAAFGGAPILISVVYFEMLTLCGHALAIKQPGFGIDNAGLHDAARTLLELIAFSMDKPEPWLPKPDFSLHDPSGPYSPNVPFKDVNGKSVE